MPQTSIVIIGGGFTGVIAAKELARQKTGHVTLINPTADFLFTPRLVDVLSGQITRNQLVTSQAQLAKKQGYRFIHGRVTDIFAREKRLVIKNTNGEEQSVSYDILVEAQGGQTHFFGVPGASEYAFPLKTEAHFQALENHIKQIISQAKTTKEPLDRLALLSFCVVGGGATGIEALLALETRVRRLLGPGPLQKEARFTILHAGPEILPGFLPKTIERTRLFLQEKGVTISVNDPVTRVTEASCETKSGNRIVAKTIIWGGGLAPNMISTDVPLESTPNGLPSDPFLRIYPSIFAGGDIALTRDKQRTVPKNAQTAFKMGHALAKNIRHHLQKQPLQPFHYFSLGTILWLGSTAILDLGPFSIKTPLISWARHWLYQWRFWQIKR